MRRFLSLSGILSVYVLMVGCQEPKTSEKVAQCPEDSPKAKMVLVIPIVIDNTDKAFKTEGSWDSAWTGKDFKDESVWAYADTNPTAKAVWTPDIKVAGNYEVLVWYGDDPNYDHATNAPFTINYSGGSKTVVVNQQENIGKWYSLGTYKFDIGTQGTIVLTNKANGNIVADAIKIICKDR